jgi:amidohydrolase
MPSRNALRINEEGGAPYRSPAPGAMPACGHDGHTAMLLGAAKLLVAEGGFDGTVRFVFQPAEEWGKGALAMMEDGLLKRFPFDEIYGLHNMPGLPIGHFQTRQGGLMSAEDNFEIVLKGVGGHAARPHWGREVLVAACALVMDLQTIVSRRLSPTDVGVVSVTELLTDGTRNVLPGLARILGDVRSFSPQVSDTIETEMRRIADGLALVYACKASVSYSREFVPLLNDPSLTNEAMTAAATVFPPGAVGTAAEPMTASEDFARFLEHVPGCFAFIGNGEGSKPLHNPFYDFADAALIHGARFHGAIVRRRLPIV